MMETKVEIVPYSEAYSGAHRDFAVKTWPEKRRRREERYLRWKFRGPEHGEVKNFRLAVMGDAVVGQVGGIPVEIRIAGQTYQAQWFCDLMGDPEAKGKWIGIKLARDSMARNKILLTSNPSAAADAVMRRVGFKTIEGPQVMLLPLKLSHVLSWKVPDKMSFLIPLLAQLGRPILSWRSRRLRWVKRQNLVRRLPWQEVTSLIEQHQKNLTYPHVVHDADFLQWRCAGLPGFAAKLNAIATDAGGYAILEEGGPYLYVQDWFAPTAKDFIALYQEIMQIAREAGSKTIQTLAQDETETEMLLSVGFLLRHHRIKIMCYPPEMFIPAWDKFYYCWYDSDGNL